MAFYQYGLFYSVLELTKRLKLKMNTSTYNSHSQILFERDLD